MDAIIGAVLGILALVAIALVVLKVVVPAARIWERLVEDKAAREKLADRVATYEARTAACEVELVQLRQAVEQLGAVPDKPRDPLDREIVGSGFDSER